MALLVTVDNRPIFVKPEVGVFLWMVKTGERKAASHVHEKVKKIARFYLNRDNAPLSYLEAYPTPEDTKKARFNQVRLPYVD